MIQCHMDGWMDNNHVMMLSIASLMYDDSGRIQVIISSTESFKRHDAGIEVGIGVPLGINKQIRWRNRFK